MRPARCGDVVGARARTHTNRENRTEPSTEPHNDAAAGSCACMSHSHARFVVFSRRLRNDDDECFGGEAAELGAGGALDDVAQRCVRAC